MSCRAAIRPQRKAIDGVTTAAVLPSRSWLGPRPFRRFAPDLQAFGPTELGALRFAIAAVPAAIFLAVTRPALPTCSDSWRLAFGGILFVALYTALLNFGEMTVSAGAASFIINANPIMTAVLAMLLLGERFTRRAWLGTALSFAGIGLIAFGEGRRHAPRHRGAADPRRRALHAGHDRRAEAAVRPPQAADRLGLEHGDRRARPRALAADAASELASRPPVGIQRRSISASCRASSPMATWAVALSRLPASRATNFMYCVPPVATLLGFLWLGEVPTLLGAIGGVLALIGVAVVNWRR